MKVVNMTESLKGCAGAVQTEFLPGDFKLNETKKGGGVNAL